MVDDFDDKEEGIEENNENSGEPQLFRVRIPRGKQTLGILEQRLGGSRMRVRCADGKIRICRVPGRLKKKIMGKGRRFIINRTMAFRRR